MGEAHECGSWSPTSENLMESQYPLHRACRDGDLEALSLLLSVGTDFYQEDGFYGWTPIHWAAHFGKFTCLMRLIEHGCNCDHSTDRFNQTPLHMAAQNGKGHCLKWLLHCGAAINRQLACLRKLVIERSVGLDTITSKFSQTALHLCAQSGQPHCLQWLVQSGANVHMQDYMGETPIHKSARTGNMECVSLLISQGTKLSIRNHSGQTPSQLAAASGHHECASYIDRAAQLEQSQRLYEPPPVINPSSDLKSDQHHIDRVITNGDAMEEDDDDMETDMSVLPMGHRVNPLAGTKRSREHCDEDACKKSRKDEPAHWHNQNSFYQQINGFTNHCSGKNQNGLLFQDSNGFNHHNNCKFQNGFLQIENGQIKNHDNGFLPQMNAQNNNSICESSSTVEHYNSVLHQQGYDSLLMESFSNQYDGS